MGLEQLSRLQVYLAAYVAVAVLVSLWVLPGLVGALTPIRARDILSESHSALVVAFIADARLVPIGTRSAVAQWLGWSPAAVPRAAGATQPHASA
jgi:Na+/H+-dicarboxylate symporter